MRKPLQEVFNAHDALLSAKSRYQVAIQKAVAAGVSKSVVAEAAGISRPTLYKILKD